MGYLRTCAAREDVEGHRLNSNIERHFGCKFEEEETGGSSWNDRCVMNTFGVKVTGCESQCCERIVALNHPDGTQLELGEARFLRNLAIYCSHSMYTGLVRRNEYCVFLKIVANGLWRTESQRDQSMAFDVQQMSNPPRHLPTNQRDFEFELAVERNRIDFKRNCFVSIGRDTPTVSYNCRI
jgi:hypothetical protein